MRFLASVTGALADETGVAVRSDGGGRAFAVAGDGGDGAADVGAVARVILVLESPRGAGTTLRVGARSRARLAGAVARLLSFTGDVVDAIGADAEIGRASCRERVEIWGVE